MVLGFNRTTELPLPPEVRGTGITSTIPSTTSAPDSIRPPTLRNYISVKFQEVLEQILNSRPFQDQYRSTFLLLSLVRHLGKSREFTDFCAEKSLNH